ncbi:MAG: hypothetical protein JNM18_02065 [Planctomycetaceae bacterium]|nr:hypothetical protein [Planctomycetaceae bacterium]
MDRAARSWDSVASHTNAFPFLPRWPMNAAPALGGGFVLLQLVQVVIGIGSLVCFVMVLIQMFQRGQTGVGIASIVLSLCGIGPLIALVYGWIKASEWGIQKLMLVWTGLIVIGMVVAGFAVVVGGAAIMNDPEFQKQLQEMQKQ